ncbi:uncharacterized protein LOC132188996 [Corylus avellana]|uniref:uncharacterized protein LOC132188996 n=1 Tax=Corylus avellana TaxID=13451 RepID=UPI00286B2D4C|nr:uncharacterized protein LOC132188996 [Corylus avellana]
MEKRASLGVQRRKPIKRSKKKLLKRVVDYLRSDSYMFAPLVSPRSKTFRSSAIGVEVKEPIKEPNNNRLLKKIGEYLKSDSYMYASLVASSQSISPPIGPSQCMNRVTMAVFKRRVTMVENEPTDHSTDEVAEDQMAKSFLHKTRISEEHNFHRETVKRMVFRNCRSISVSGKERLNSRLRKVVD